MASFALKDLGPVLTNYMLDELLARYPTILRWREEQMARTTCPCEHPSHEHNQFSGCFHREDVGPEGPFDQICKCTRRPWTTIRMGSNWKEGE